VGGFLVDEPKSFAGIRRLAETVHQKIYSLYCNSIPTKLGEATRSVGRSHSSDEVFVMKVERRASVIQSQYFETTLKRE
jgi:hypothetical protein